MKPRATPHAVDLRDVAIIRGAVEFSAALFLGVGRYARAEAASIPEIKAEATRLETAHPGRRALIYAINAAGRSAVITPDLETLMQEQDAIFTQSYSAKSAAIRALKRSGLDPDKAEVRKQGARFVIRPPSAPKEEAKAEAPKLKQPAPAKAKAAKPAPARKAEPERPRAQAKAQAKGARVQAPVEAKPRRNAAYEAQLAAALSGRLPREPDFSAQTHAPYRKRLAAITEAAKARDIAALKAMEIRPYNSSMVPLARYRDLCVTALEASA